MWISLSGVCCLLTLKFNKMAYATIGLLMYVRVEFI
jgi:hypothetical protein